MQKNLKKTRKNVTTCTVCVLIHDSAHHRIKMYVYKPKSFLSLLIDSLLKKLSSVGFEPTHINVIGLKPIALDRSANLTFDIQFTNIFSLKWNIYFWYPNKI